MKTVFDGRFSPWANFKKYPPNYYAFCELDITPSIDFDSEEELFILVDSIGITMCGMSDDKCTLLAMDKPGKNYNYLKKVLDYLEKLNYTVIVKEKILFFHDNRRYKRCK